MTDSTFENEKVLSNTANGLVNLTTHRVQLKSSTIGRVHIISILLNRVSSISSNYRSKPIYLVISFLALAAGGYLYLDNSEDAALVPFAFSVIFFIAYFFSRKHRVSIASCGGDIISFSTTGMSKDSVISFIDEVEAAIENNRNRAQ